MTTEIIMVQKVVQERQFEPYTVQRSSTITIPDSMDSEQAASIVLEKYYDLEEEVDKLIDERLGSK